MERGHRCGGVQFSNTTSGTGQQTTWQWSFGDGTTSNDAQPIHVFPGPGTYEVCLTAVSIFISPNSPALTCVDVFCAPVTIGNVEPTECDPSFALEIESEPTNAGFVLHATTNLPNDGISWVFSNGLVLFGPTIQVGALSDLNLELCIHAWYLLSNTNDTCWATVCGTLGQLGFAVGVSEQDAITISVYPNPTQDALFINGMPTGSVRVRVFAADGRLELETQGVGAPLRLDLEGLAPGLKWVRVRAEGREHQFKVVKE
ncbi:MAG: PKD domain-containing protein [Flavobacteriales bacterium]|nr:PKD domain-containing protein [Flavobacteriales bacterium]